MVTFIFVNIDLVEDRNSTYKYLLSENPALFDTPVTISVSVFPLAFSIASLFTLILKGFWFVQTVPVVGAAAIVLAGTVVRHVRVVPQYRSISKC